MTTSCSSDSWSSSQCVHAQRGHESEESWRTYGDGDVELVGRGDKRTKRGKVRVCVCVCVYVFLFECPVYREMEIYASFWRFLCIFTCAYVSL